MTRLGIKQGWVCKEPGAELWGEWLAPCGVRGAVVLNIGYLILEMAVTLSLSPKTERCYFYEHLGKGLSEFRCLA